jgi:hypothetical protein
VSDAARGGERPRLSVRVGVRRVGVRRVGVRRVGVRRVGVRRVGVVGRPGRTRAAPRRAQAAPGSGVPSGAPRDSGFSGFFFP